MDRFTKIVLEQLKRGEFGQQPASEETLRLLDRNDGGVTAFHIAVNPKRGQNFGPYSIATRAIPISKWNKYNTKEYIYVIGEPKKQARGKKRIDVYPIWIMKLNENPVKQLDNNTLRDNSSGKAGNKTNGAYVFTLNQYIRLHDLVEEKERDAEVEQELQTYRQEKEKEAAAEKEAAELEKIKTFNIDVNNLSNGTADAKAFQELLYQVGLKYVSDSTPFKKFAPYRSEKDGKPNWKGNIATLTLDMLSKVGLKAKWNNGDKAGVIKDLRDALEINESTNYFKGTGMNIKLKGLLREQLNIKADDDVYGSGASLTPPPSPSKSNKTKKKSAPTPKEEPAEKDDVPTGKTAETSYFDAHKLLTNFLQSENNFWNETGDGVNSAKVSLEQFFKGFQGFYDDDEAGAAAAYYAYTSATITKLSNQGKKQLEDDYIASNQFKRSGLDYNIKIFKGNVDKIVTFLRSVTDQIDDYFQNEVRVTIVNPYDGRTKAITVEPEIG